MEMVDSFLKLLAAYPTWAKATVLLALVVGVGVLVFARPAAPSPLPQPQDDGPLYLRIARVALFPDDPSAEVQVIANVNGTEYIFPSVANVKWMNVGPDMSQKIIPLPNADLYQIRFYMNFRSGVRAANEAPHKLVRRPSNPSEQPTKLPHAAEYKLYRVDAATNSSAVLAVIGYQLTPDGQ
jgi:hypothetical protein